MVSRTAYHATFLTTMDRFEGKLQGRIVADKKTFINAAAKIYGEHGTPNFFHLVDNHQQQLFDTLKAHYHKIIPVFGALSLSQVKSRSFKASAEDDLFSDLADQWVHTQGLKRSKLIADTSEADVLKAISDGLDEGEGTAEIADRIQDVTELSDYRAEMIARTETHAAANYASVEGVRNAQDKLGVVMLKEWLPTLDGRTRPDHAAMEGSEPIGMDEKFLVGGEELDRPGDPAGSADQVINCRCVLGFSEAKE
jgi:SPP1 gp7 family putative phage head morphogenesis protein